MAEKTERKTRNEQIAEMLENGELLKNFYRFTAQNPHIELHDACQIVLVRPKASICFYIDEWNDMGRRVTKNRRGIQFYNADGDKQYVYDLHDTHGDKRYRRLIYPMRRLLHGLDELNGTSLAESNRRDYSKVLSGVAQYLDENGYFTEDERRNSLIAEGVAYSLYSKTGFPKDDGIALRGMPYGLDENARLFKEIYLLTELAKEDISAAYERRVNTPQVIDDIEEETVSDEPVLASLSDKTEPFAAEEPAPPVSEGDLPEVRQKEEPKPPANPMYARYMSAQRDKPDAVVLIRLGDFYEVMGERAREVSEWLNLTLTSRDVGLSERVPMCGFPYHVTEQYLQAILEHRGVYVLEPDAEPIYILSRAELSESERSETAPVSEEEQPFDKTELSELQEILSSELADGQAAERPVLTEIEDDEPNPFDEQEPEEEPDGTDWEEAFAEPVPEEVKPAPKKDEKGIQDRKRKQKPQMSMFDMLDGGAEKSREDEFVDYCLKKEHSDYKLDYYDAYRKNLPVSEFVALFKRHYGEYSGQSDSEKWITNTTKGRTIERRDKEHPENNFTVNLKWPEVAVRIAELIENDDYLTADEKKEYARIVRFRNERENAKTDSERCKVIADQIVEYGTQKTYGEVFSEYPHFLEDYAQFYFEHKQEVDAVLAERKEVRSVNAPRDYLGMEVNVSFYIKYCPHWQEVLRGRLAREHRIQNFADGFTEDCASHYDTAPDGETIEWTVTPDEIGERDYLFIKDNRNEFIEYLQSKAGVVSAEFSMERIEIAFDRDYIAGIAGGSILPPGEHTRLVREIANKIVAEGTKNTTEGNWVHFFDEFGENDAFAQENAEQIAAELERRQEVSDVVLTPDAFDTNFYLDYCPNYIPKEGEEGFEDEQDEEYASANDSPKDRQPFNRFKELSETDKAFIEQYSLRAHREPVTSPWDEVQHCATIAKGIYSVSTAGHGGIMIDAELAPYVLSSEALREGLREGGYYCYEEDAAIYIPLRELYDKGILKKTDRYFTDSYVVSDKDKKNGYVPYKTLPEAEKEAFIGQWSTTLDEDIAQWYPEYWQARQSAEQNAQNGKNTDLNSVLDQTDLGGAKTRFKNNVAAIRLAKFLHERNAAATDAERKTLAKYVGWGGLPQAFDETNRQWQKEYAELKSLLTSEEYEAAKGSVLNAHYTSGEVIGGIYAALERLGVKGNNRILEPAMGTGNFFGYMPKEIMDGAKLYGVELDTVTGRIASKLYPQANVQVKGFEETNFPNDYFDIVVSNVPFGGYGVYDSEYSRHKFLIHDYFIAKSIDKVKPGGIVAVVTSKGTLDKLNPTARKYMAERAELLGAIRLPNTAFRQTANTEAVTDILFFKKRAEKISDTGGIEWLGTGKTEDGFEVNNYFIRHPEMVLGTFAKETGLYGAEGLTVKPDGRPLGEAIAAAVENLPQNVYENPDHAAADVAAMDDGAVFNVRPMCYAAVKGKLYMRVGDRLVLQEIPAFPKDAYSRLEGMIGIRDELRRVLDMQTKGCTDEELKRAQSVLSARYDSFVRKYGFLNGQTNARLFREDGDAALLFACETLSEDKTRATKADVFTKRTIRPYAVPTHTGDTLEALQICRNERGGVDIAYIEELTGKDYDTVTDELGDAIFRDPVSVKEGDKYSGYVTAEEYLSGKVVEKLRIARHFAAEDTAYARNVAALEKVQPEPLKADEISVRIGASWVDADYYKEFLMEILGIYGYYSDGLNIRYNTFDGSWKVERADHVRNNAGYRATETYGTNRANAFRLFEDCLNQRATQIFDTVEENGKEKRVLNKGETIAAREKQNKIKEAFTDWIYADPHRREDLEKTYNRLFNQIRLPSYDGSFLKFPGMNPTIELRPHQKNAAARIAGTGNSTLLHHVVGSGKSYTMAASAMKLRQYGLAKKPMIVVPNHLVQQMASEFRTLYPTAKILIAGKEDLEKNKRQQFVSKVAMGDWDSVIIAQSSFAKIPVSQERQERKMREEIAKIEAAILEMRGEGGSRTAVKNLERIKKGREAMLKKLTDSSKKDGVFIFENLGVDYLFVDEADAYKNLFLYTKMNNVSGISNAASARASDMQMKIEYIGELHGGDKGVVFATGTPISNSMAEMYVMQTYLQKHTLEELGINYFDAWAADFGETVTALEMAPSGQGYRARTRFAKFTNLPELMTLYRSFADVQTSDMVKLDVPEAERTTITLEPSEQTVQIAEEIAKRAERIYGGNVDPHIDNMLKVTSDGKKLALDIRCFDCFLKDEHCGKLDMCADNAAKVYAETTVFRGTQLIFCDLSTPKKPYESYEYGKDFDAYNDLKHKLIERGVPQNEIAFIHDAKTDKDKQALFDKMNEGKIRILIGSTEKCGAGTNVQRRLAALHHLDAPYRPRDLQQRDGRGIRQGNDNKTVKIFTYVTKRTLDSYCYQILENKQRFISQIESGSLTVREAEDIDETTLSYAEIKAITAANPKIKQKMELEAELARLRVLEGQYKKNLYSLQDKVYKDLPAQIRRQEQIVKNAQADEAAIKEKYNAEVFSVNVQGRTYTDKKEGAAALMDALRSNRYGVAVAEYGGLKISLNVPEALTSRSVTLTGSGEYVMEIAESELGLITRLDNFLKDFPEKRSRFSAKLEQLRSNLAVAEEELKKPFEHKGKIEEITKELSEINAGLDLNKREEVVIDTDEETESEEETNFMALPQAGQEKQNPEKRSHRRMTERLYALYAERKSQKPDAVIFIKNGEYYETCDDDAKSLAFEYGFTTYEKELGGRKRTVAMLGYDDLDAAVSDMSDENRRVEIIEPENEIDREVDFLETENEAKAIAENESAEREPGGFVWYCGKDTENTAYAYVRGELNEQTFKEIAEYGDGADAFVIAADSAALDTRARSVVYLEIGREIQEEDLSDETSVIGKMQRAADKLTKERADRSMALYQSVRNSVLNEYAAFEKNAEDELPYRQRFYKAVADYFASGQHNLLSEQDVQKLMRGNGRIIERLYDYDRDGVSHDVGNATEMRVLIEYYNENTVSENAGTEDKDYAAVVREQAGAFYERYKAEHPDYANNLGRNLFYRNMSEYLRQTDTLPYAYFMALDRDGEKMLPRLAAFYEQNGDLALHTYRERQEVIEQYAEKYYPEELRKASEPRCFGKGADGTAYYFMPDGLSQDSLSDIGKLAEGYVIAAPKCTLPEARLEEYKIMFLKTGRDIPDKAVYGTAETAKREMRTEAEKVRRNADTLERVAKNARAALKELQADPNTERAGYKERFFAAYAEFIEDVDDYYLDGEDFAELVKDGSALTERVYAYYMDTSDQINIEDWSELSELTKNYINDRWKMQRAMTEDVPLYGNSFEYARANGEEELYRRSLQANIECRHEIEQTINKNFDGYRLNKGFERELVEKFGMERVGYVLASTVQSHDWDGRFSPETKAWAKAVAVREDMEHRRQFEVASHPAVLDGFIARIRAMEKETKKEQKEMQEERYRTETARGLPVVHIERDKYGHGIAIVKRQKDYVVAIGYDVKDGTWAQGRYDFVSQESAQAFIDEKYKPQAESKWLTAKVSRDALIRRYDRHSFMRMPNGEYEGYTYNIYNSRIKESRQLVDMESDGRELCYELVFPANGEVTVKNRDGDEVIFTVQEFVEIIGGTSNKDYERRERADDTSWYAISVPQEALRGTYEKSSLFSMPANGEFAGYSFYIPNVFVEEDKRGESGNILITLPEDFNVTLKNRATDEELVVTAYDVFEACNGTKEEDYARTAQESGSERKTVKTVIPANAKIAEYKTQTLFKMPETGEYAGYCFYLFNDQLKPGDAGIEANLSENFEVLLRDNRNDRHTQLTAEEFKAVMDGTANEDFGSELNRPSETRIDKFNGREELLRKNLPPEMLTRPNWVIVRTRQNEEKGRPDKFLISPVTGKFAEIDNPETWTDFDTACKYAHENGGVSLAYALDGKDNICCIDLDHCFNGNRQLSDTAKEAWQACGDTYREISVSRNGLHIFGKTDGMDVRSFSKDGKLEFYQKSHFITVTGDRAGNDSNLANFDVLPIKGHLEEVCGKHAEWKGAGQGVEGLSSMSDRDVVEKACSAKNGATFKAYYEGQDLKHNHSNSDMALMTYLAFWCNGDVDQMLRINATSGLYRPEKSPEYYEHTAMKAVRENAERFQPKREQKSYKPRSANGADKGGK